MCKGVGPGSLSGVPRDMGMAKEVTKVHLVLVLNQGTLSHLDLYIIMRGINEIAHLGTIQDKLHHVPYV